jgi:hypothetical protein
MGILEFLASLVESLAWPTILGICIYIFRAQVGKLLERLSKVKYGDLEAEFQERLNNIEPVQNVKKLKIKEEEKNITTITLEELSVVSPRSAILEAWIKVEKATSEFCEANQLATNPSYQALFQVAKEKDLDIEPFKTAYQELRLLRNKAVHASDSDITSLTAKQYVKTAEFIIAELGMRAYKA